jgi:hypothetical protein
MSASTAAGFNDGKLAGTASGRDAAYAFRMIPVPLVVFAITCVILLPWFFDTYRIMAFNTVPRDDYAPFLLHLCTGRGVWPTAPFGYRVLSIVPAIPLYWMLPLVKFSKLPSSVDPSYWRATQALAFLSFISIAAAATISFQFVRTKLGGTLSQAGFIALLTITLAGFTARYGIEPFALFVIFALLYEIDRPVIFSLAVLPSAFVNEKVAMFFLFLTVSRAIFVRGFFRAHRWQTCAAIAASVTYAVVLKTVHLHGDEWESTVGLWIPQTIEALKISMSSVKALELNIIPLVVITTPCIAFSFFSNGSTKLLARSDFLVPLGLFEAGLAAATGVTVGRIIALAIPLTVLSCALLLVRYDHPNDEAVLDTA